MEIYRLKDEVPEGWSKAKRRCDADGGSDGGVSEGLKITGMKQGVKNPERVNVFINGKFSFSLNVAQVVDFRLKIGMIVPEGQLAEYKKASEYGKLYQRTLEWALVRPRSVRETRDYLVRKLKKPSLDEFFDEIISRLLTKGHLDDKKFAEFYVENRFVKKGISKKRLRMELVKKGVSKDIIDEVLDGRDEEEEIEKMILKKRAKYDDEKLVQYLCRQGFSYELAREKVAEVGGEVRDVD